MAIIQCPSCNKSVSDKASNCPHCGTPIRGVSKEDSERHLRLQHYHRVQSIQTQSMIAMLLFIGGFGVMFWGDVEPSTTQHTIALSCSVIGFVWYVVNRIRLIFVKKGQ